MSPSAPSLDAATRQRLEATLHALEADRGSNWPLLAGIAASLLFHGALMVPQVREFFAQIHLHDGVDRTRRASFSVEKEMEKRPAITPEQQQVEEEEMLKLGIEDGTTQSTMTWIGYNEYQEHIAKLSTVDQAAFRDTDEGGQPMPMARESTPTTPQVPKPEPTAPASPDVNPNPSGPAVPAMSAPPTPAAPQTPPPSPMQPVQPQQPAPPPPPSPTDTKPAEPEPTRPVAPPPETAATRQTRPEKDGVPIPSADENRVAPQLQPVEKAGPAKDPTDAPTPPTADKPLDVPPAPPTPKPEDPKPDQPKPDEAKPPQEAKPTDAPTPPQQPTPAQPPQQAQPSQPAQPASAPPTQAAPGPAQPSTSPTTGPNPDPSARPGAKPGPKADGDLSDRESDATSVTAAPTKDWKSGKPLAAKGIKVNTKRPFFDELTTISTNPQNPLALIEFNQAGKAVSATLLEGTGFDAVDQPIIDSLYAWTVDVARSPQLQKLKPGQTLKFKIRLLLK